ncbi:MAG: transglycosylase domain-containing protein [Dialister invisus]
MTLTARTDDASGSVTQTFYCYLTAFANKVTPFDILSNETKDFGGGWIPKNYGGTSGGSVTVMEALVKSMNIPTVHLADQVGIEKIIRTAKNVGISTLVTDGEYSDTNLAASLGGLAYGVSVWDMAKAYSVFANGGKLVEPTVIMKVVDRNGKVLEDHSGAPESTQVVDEASAWTLTSVLGEVISRGTGGNAYIGRPSAGKTGTTDDEHDAWFVGYTPDLSTAVWIGDDASTNAGYTGGTIPAAIWRDYMYEAESGYTVKNFEIPASVRSNMEKARAARAKQESGSGGRKEEKGRRQGENKKKALKRISANLRRNKLLDRISGRSAEKSGEKQ